MKKLAIVLPAAFAAWSASLSAAAQTRGPFDGLYAGGEAGWQTIDLSVDQAPATSAEDGGASYAVIVGYRKQFENDWVGGLEASLGRATAEGVLDVTLAGTPRRFAVDTGWQYGMDAIFGYRLTGTTLLFARAGYRQMDLNVRLEDMAGAAFAEAADGVVDGYRLGGGMEFELTDEINVRVGGLYTRYGGDPVTTKVYGVQAGAIYHY